MNIEDILKNKGPLTKPETGLLIALMDRITFPAPSDIFLAWERNFYDCAVELAILRDGPQGQEIFLTLRPKDDLFWPDQWHMPGAIILPGKKCAETLPDLMQRELGQMVGNPEFVHVFEFSRSERVRGQGFSFLYKVKVGDEVAKTMTRGTFFPLNELPEALMEHHITMVEKLKTCLA